MITSVLYLKADKTRLWNTIKNIWLWSRRMLSCCLIWWTSMWLFNKWVCSCSWHKSHYCDIDMQHHPAQSSRRLISLHSFSLRESKTRVCVGSAESPEKNRSVIRQSAGKCVNGTDSKVFFYNFDVQDNVQNRREQLRAAKRETWLLLFLSEKGTV